MLFSDYYYSLIDFYALLEYARNKIFKSQRNTNHIYACIELIAYYNFDLNMNHTGKWMFEAMSLNAVFINHKQIKTCDTFYSSREACEWLFQKTSQEAKAQDL